MNRRLWYLLGLLVADSLFFTLTNPHTVPSLLLIAGLGLVIATLYWLFRGFFAFISLYLPPLKGQRQRLAAFCTGTAAVLLALQSIQQLSLHDALVIVPIAVVLYIYVSFVRRRSAT